MTTVTSQATGLPQKTQRHLPGEPGIWLFIVGDLIIFSAFFVVFLYYRAQDIALFQSSQLALSQTFGVTNTLVLLTSSWFAATAVQAARKGMTKLARFGLVFTFLCGAIFCTIKFFEYSEKIHAGITLNSDLFFIFYYMFTGIHMLHVIIAMGILVFVWNHTRKDTFEASDIQVIEIGVSFWHLVDLLWIVLFALLYLIR